MTALPGGAQTALFSAPNDRDGWMGISGLTAHGIIDHPKGPDLKPNAGWLLRDDGSGTLWSEELLDQAFWDPIENAVTWVVSINSAGNWGSALGPYHYASFWLARSPDGKSFPAENWKEIFYSDPEEQRFRVHHASLLPLNGPTSQYYAMLFGITEIQPDGSFVRTHVRAELDIRDFRFRVLQPTGWSNWKNWGSRLRLPLANASGPVHSRTTSVDGELQQWYAQPDDRSGDPPCDPMDPEYLFNTANHLGGVRPSYKTYSLSTSTSGPRLDAQPAAWNPSNLQDVWTDYGGTMASGFTWGENLRAVVEPRMIDFGSDKILYYGSTDLRICEYGYDWNPHHGGGVKALRMERQPNGEYSLIQTDWLVNVVTENWSCDPNTGPEICYADEIAPPNQGDLRNYAFMGANPVKIPAESEIFFYVPVWGGFEFQE